MDNNNFSLTVNGKFVFDLSAEEIARLDILNISHGRLHLLKDAKSYQAQVINIDLDSKTISLQVDHQKFVVEVADGYDILVKKMGLDIKLSHQINEIRAPMPGLVLSLNVREGQEIKQGDPLLVLEAMKMENVIKSPGEGTVKTISAQIGKPVEKGAVLIYLE